MGHLAHVARRGADHHRQGAASGGNNGNNGYFKLMGFSDTIRSISDYTASGVIENMESELINSSGTESISCTKQNLLSVIFKLVSKFTNGSCFPCSVNTNHHDNIRFFVARAVEIIKVFIFILLQNVLNLFLLSSKYFLL